MATSIETPIKLFLRRVEKDKSFFNYFNLQDFEAKEVAYERAKVYLDEAIGRLYLECTPEVDFISRDEEGNFTFDWSVTELLLIPSLMYEMYLDRSIAYLKELNVDYTPSELKVFDPSNARSSFNTLYQNVQARNEYLIDRYRNTMRENGSYKTIDFTLYDFTSEV